MTSTLQMPLFIMERDRPQVHSIEGLDERKNLLNEESWSKAERLLCVPESQHVCLVNPLFLDGPFPKSDRVG